MDKHLGARLKEARKARGMEQTELAALVPGLTNQSISNLERRNSRTSEHAVQIADALRISLRWLLSGQGSRDDLEWPFPRVERSRWDACSEGDRGYVQAAINRALDECEADREAARRKA